MVTGYSTFYPSIPGHGTPLIITEGEAHPSWIMFWQGVGRFPCEAGDARRIRFARNKEESLHGFLF